MSSFNFNPFGYDRKNLLSPKQQAAQKEEQKEFNQRLRQRSPDAIASAIDFLKFREYVCGQETYPHMMAWHHALNTGESNRFLKGIAGEDTCILAPRNSAKSTFLLQWVAWVIGTHAMQGISLKILYISYVVDIATSKSRQIKSIIESEKYQETFPKVRKNRSKWGEGEWAIDFQFAGLRTIDEAYTVACSGLYGATNAKRCLAFDSWIVTEKGDFPISQFHQLIGVKVKCFDIKTNQVEWKRVTGFAKRETEELYHVITFTGHKIRCTGNHPFYIKGIGYYKASGFYKEAQHLKKGDTVVARSHEWEWEPDTILSVEKVPANETVYDIEVEDNHNFFANGVLVHNSHLGIFDDLLKDRPTAQNKQIQDRITDNYNNVIRYTKHEGARFINLGTRFAKHDVYNRIFIVPKWRVITQSALVIEDGQERSFCEPVSDEEQGMGISLETLRKERAEDLESFMLQRQNQIPVTSSSGILPHFIKYVWLPTEFERIVIGMDLASSVDGNYNAMVVLGISENKIYVCDAYQERIQGNMKKIDKLYTMWARRKDMSKNPAILAVDHNKYMIDFKGDLEDYLLESEDNFKYLQIQPVKSTGRGEKIERLMSHSALFEKGRVFFNRVSVDLGVDNLPIIELLVRQISDYNPMDSNDLMDALENGIFVARDYINSELSSAG